MISRAVVGASMLLLAAFGPAATAEKPLFSILYLSRAGDPAYEQRRSYAGLALRDKKPPVDGARIALRESRIRGRALGLHFELAEQELAPGAGAGEAVRAAGPRAVLLDLPLDEVEAVVAELGGRDDLILFNIRHPDDRLRAQGCAPALLHTLPSRAMLADALAQYLAAQGWRRTLVLAGADASSAATAAAFVRAAQKFGLRIVETRVFELTNDPRRRDRNNIALLTGGADHDVVFLADEIGEFGRYVPYATYAPRPVVGTEGLRPATQPALRAPGASAHAGRGLGGMGGGARRRRSDLAHPRNRYRGVAGVHDLGGVLPRPLQGRAGQFPAVVGPVAPTHSARRSQRHHRARATGTIPAPEHHS